MIQSKAIFSFIAQNIQHSNNYSDIIPTQKLYDKYIEFCEANNERNVSRFIFTREVKKLGIEKAHMRIPKTQSCVQCFKYVKFIDANEAVDTTKNKQVKNNECDNKVNDLLIPVSSATTASPKLTQIAQKCAVCATSATPPHIAETFWKTENNLDNNKNLKNENYMQRVSTDSTNDTENLTQPTQRETKP